MYKLFRDVSYINTSAVGATPPPPCLLKKKNWRKCWIYGIEEKQNCLNKQGVEGYILKPNYLFLLLNKFENVPPLFIIALKLALTSARFSPEIPPSHCPIHSETPSRWHSYAAEHLIYWHRAGNTRFTPSIREEWNSIGYLLINLKIDRCTFVVY